MHRSYERINYAVRPAKCIERKMLCESFRRLSEFRLVSSYRYVGFGSTYFSDFSLFHKELNLADMISIEHDVGNRARFDFNRPYQCVQMRYGSSNVELPLIPWNGIPTIIWLDYDGPIGQNVLNDVQTVCTSASSGSVLVISINVTPPTLDLANPEERLEFLTNEVGELNIPRGTRSCDLTKQNYAKVCRKIIDNQIMQTLAHRNGPLGNCKINYQQLFHFHYADGAQMLTVGGLLFDDGQAARFSACAFDKLPFVRMGEDAYTINTPNLTLREIRFLNTLLPTSDPASLSANGVPLKDIRNYAGVYRYFPVFAETDC